MSYPYMLIVFMVLTGLLVIPAMAGNDTVTNADVSDRAAGRICTTPDGTADIVVTGIRNTSASVDCSQVLAGWESIPAPLNTAPESAAGTRALITGGVDDAYTKSLMHFNGNNGNTTFTDEIGKTWYPSGNAQISTTQSKFGGASAYFDGNGDYLYSDDSPDWDLGSQFTVDF